MFHSSSSNTSERSFTLGSSSTSVVQVIIGSIITVFYVLSATAALLFYMFNLLFSSSNKFRLFSKCHSAAARRFQ